MTFRETVKADLIANFGKAGLKAGISAFLFHPGFSAIFLHRLALRLKKAKLGFLGKIIWRWNVDCCGCHFHMDSQIGPGLYLPHPVGVVVGSGAKIGANVTLYQGSTLGKGGRPNSYPVVGDGVILFPNAVVFGAITIGDGAIIGAGSILFEDVAAGQVVSGNPARPLER